MNDARLPATVQLFRDGDEVGPPVHADGYSESCRSTGGADLLGSLDVEVDPVGPAGTFFPESLRGILVTTTAYRIDVVLVEEGIEPYGQSTYRVRDR